MISIKSTSAMGSTYGHLGLHRQPDLANMNLSGGNGLSQRRKKTPTDSLDTTW
jgi:hypothetical protein